MLIFFHIRFVSSRTICRPSWSICKPLSPPVASDDMLICQIYHVPKKTAGKLGSDDLKTKRADNFFNNLSTDQYQNITAEFRVKGDLHRQCHFKY